MKKLWMTLALTAAAALFTDVSAAEPIGTTKKVCENTSCVAAACPAGTASQHGACRCNKSCGCTGSIKCYDGAGVLIATKECDGDCDWVTPAPIEPEPVATDATLPAQPADAIAKTPVVAAKEPAKEPTKEPTHKP